MVPAGEFAYRMTVSIEARWMMHRDETRSAYSDGGLWLAFVSAAVAGSLVAFFIAP